MSATTRRLGNLSALTLGKIFVTVAALAAVALFQKADIAAMLRSGETIDIHFAEAHRLRESVSKVKIAGVDIGIVRSVERRGDGTTAVSVKVDDDVLDAMGTAPSAKVRPATLLGGNYYVEIIPGGRNGEFTGDIPMKRTSLPVELDGVASAFPYKAREGVRSSVKALNGTLRPTGSESLQDLMQVAPTALGPMAGVLKGLQGTKPNRDLRTLVSGVDSTSTVLSSENSRLAGSIEDFATTVRVLEARRKDLARTTATMPETLDQTSTMLNRLDGVLTSLEDTAEPATPSVRALSRLLERGDPVFAKARPIVHDLRSVLRDARPVVDDLAPISKDLHTSVDRLNGPVLDRVNGPILDTLMSPWSGSGDYAGGGADRPLYKETGYMLANLAAANMADGNGAMISFLPGSGAGSVSGLPGGISLEKFLAEYARSAQ